MRSKKQTQIVDKIQLWQEDAVAFVQDMWRPDLEDFQVEALQELSRTGRIAIRSGHGVGKTTLLAWISLWHMCVFYPQKTPCTAPSAPQLEDVLWPEIAFWHRKMPEVWQNNIVYKSERMELKGGEEESFAVARTARKEKPEALQGFHSQNLLFLIDEASGVEDIIFEVAQGALSTPSAKVVMTSNPTRTSGYFYDAFHRLRSRWHCMHVPCSSSSRVSDQYSEDMLAKYGEDSNVYRVRVLGEFPKVEDDAVIGLELCESAKARDVALVATAKPVWGVDVARFGDDRSALAKRQGNHQTEPVRSWRNKDTMQLSGLIYQEWQATPVNERPDSICVDVIGIGAGVVDRLRELDLPVFGVNVAEAPSVKDRYMRQRDELWFEARDWLQARDVKLADDDELIAELTLPKYEVTSGGKLKVESKDEIKKRGVISPDLADAFCLTFAVKHSGGAMKKARKVIRRT